jgi:hypothetical protein
MPRLPTAWASAALLLEQLIRSPSSRRELRYARLHFMVAGLREAFDRRCRVRERISGGVPRPRELEIFDALNRRVRVLWGMR